MKSQERRTLRRKKGEHSSHGQEVRVWENHRREEKMVIIQTVSITFHFVSRLFQQQM